MTSRLFYFKYKSTQCLSDNTAAEYKLLLTLSCRRPHIQFDEWRYFNADATCPE
jgi:hypothetical protein